MDAARYSGRVPSVGTTIPTSVLATRVFKLDPAVIALRSRVKHESEPMSLA